MARFKRFSVQKLKLNLMQNLNASEVKFKLEISMRQSKARYFLLRRGGFKFCDGSVYEIRDPAKFKCKIMRQSIVR